MSLRARQCCASQSPQASTKQAPSSVFLLQCLAVENPTPLALFMVLQDKKLEGNSTLQQCAGQTSGQHKHMSSSLGVLQGREVENNDTFKYNGGFTAALFRIKINSIQLKETHEENKKTNDQVLQDRQYQVGP